MSNILFNTDFRLLFTKNKLGKVEIFKIIVIDNTIYIKQGNFQGTYKLYEKTYPPIKKETSQQVAKRNLEKKVKDKINDGYVEVFDEIFDYTNLKDLDVTINDLFFKDSIIDDMIWVKKENMYNLEDYLDKHFEDYIPTDINGLIKPMKAVPYLNAKGEPVANKTTQYITQRKYNGLRSLLSLSADKTVKLTSFEGHFYKLIHILNGLTPEHLSIKEKDTLTIVNKSDSTEYHSCLNKKLIIYKDENLNEEEVTKKLDEKFTAEIPLIFDGEIYAHGKPLNQILSSATNYNIFSQDLNYIIYDLAIDDMVQTARLNLLNKWYKLHKNTISDSIKIAPIGLVKGFNNIDAAQKKYVAEGYEGLILRNPYAYYGFGSRSKECMIKYKNFIEAEFKVIGHRVTYKKVNNSEYPILIFLCENDIDKKTFEVTMNGDSNFISNMIDEVNYYYGKELTVKYFERSPFNIPLHAKGKGFKGKTI